MPQLGSMGQEVCYDANEYDHVATQVCIGMTPTPPPRYLTQHHLIHHPQQQHPYHQSHPYHSRGVIDYVDERVVYSSFECHFIGLLMCQVTVKRIPFCFLII